MGDKEKTVSQEVLDVFGIRRIKNRFDIDVFNLRNSIKIMEEGDLSETKRKEVVLQMLNLFSKTDVRQEVFRDGDFFESLIKAVANHLTDTGTCWLILPLDTAELVKAIAKQNKMHLRKTIAIKSYSYSKPHREMLVLSLDNAKTADEVFIIYQQEKVYSEEYVNALKDFFTIF